MEFIAADWIKSDNCEDDLGRRPGGITQKYAAEGGPEFFFIVNIQVPGRHTYSLAFYYMMSTPLEDSPLLHSFVNRDDAFRNSRFKLIPYISKGSWIVKESVRKKACLVGQALQVNYFCGKNYLELDIDVGSSTVASSVVSLVLGYLNNLFIELAFLIQQEYIRGISAWNFNLEDLKNQAALIHDYDDNSKTEESSGQKDGPDEVGFPAENPSPGVVNTSDDAPYFPYIIAIAAPAL